MKVVADVAETAKTEDRGSQVRAADSSSEHSLFQRDDVHFVTIKLAWKKDGGFSTELCSTVNLERAQKLCAKFCNSFVS